MATINQFLYDRLYLDDDAGVAITGADLNDFTATATLDRSSPVVSATVTVSEDGAGDYETVFRPTRVGRWRLEITYDDGTTERQYEGVYDVTIAPPVGLSSGRPLWRS